MKKYILLFMFCLMAYTFMSCKNNISKNAEVKAFEVSPASITLVHESVNTSQQITTRMLPENAVNVMWSSDNDRVATVSETGLVTAAGVGFTNINAVANNLSQKIPISVRSGNPYEGFETGDFLKPEEDAFLPAGYTGIEENIDINDQKYGAPQYIGKLFTEGLGRAPHPDEYKIYATHIWQNGCSQASLAYLAEKMFGSADFLGLGLTNEQTVFCVFRAILNRDPTNPEINEYVKNLRNGIMPSTLATGLTNLQEFSLMIGDMIKGPYYWNGNNTEYSASGNIMTSDELQQLLNSSLSVIELEPGTLVRVTSKVTIPAGKTLRTRGNPVHYVLQARIIQVSKVSDMVVLSSGSRLENIWVDGNRIAFDTELRNDATKIEWSGFGCTVVMFGNNIQLTGCRINDSTAGTCVSGRDYSSNLFIANNLVTCYASNHHNCRPNDGITHAARSSIIENNHIVDATDVGIVPFRFKSNNPVFEPQDTKVRNNRIINLGNSAMAGLCIDPWINEKTTWYFTGCEFINNEMWTSMKAHMHFAISLGTTAWYVQNCNPAVGTNVTDNYTPSGLFIQCSAGIVVDHVSNAVIKGNRLRLFIGDWARKCCRPTLDPRIYSINFSNSPNFDAQPGFINQAVWLPNSGLMDWNTLGEPFNSWDTREAIIFDVRP